MRNPYGELFGVRPGNCGEFLDGDPVPVVEAALVDDVRGVMADLGDDVVGGEVVGGGFQVGEREFREGRENVATVGGTSAVSGGEVVLSREKRGLATAHFIVLSRNLGSFGTTISHREGRLWREEGVYILSI